MICDRDGERYEIEIHMYAVHRMSNSPRYIKKIPSVLEAVNNFVKGFG